jgi:hypothetical protein
MSALYRVDDRAASVQNIVLCCEFRGDSGSKRGEMVEAIEQWAVSRNLPSFREQDTESLTQYLTGPASSSSSSSNGGRNKYGIRTGFASLISSLKLILGKYWVCPDLRRSAIVF